MNDRYNYQGPDLEQFFAEAELESEFRRGGSTRARSRGMRSPVSIRWPKTATRKPTTAPRPRLPFRIRRPRVRIWPPDGKKFPNLFPFPLVLHPSLWPGPYRPPFEHPVRPDQPSRPESGGAVPPPSTSPSAPPPVDAGAIEPPDTIAAEPFDTGAVSPDSGAPEPSDGDTVAPANTSTDGPSEELLQFFSGYELPGEFGTQPEYESSESGVNGRRRSRSKRACSCGHSRSTAPEFHSILGLEALDTEFEAARYSEPEWEHGETSAFTCPAFTPIAVENPGGGRIKDKRIPAKSDLVTVSGAFGSRVPLHRLTAAAHKALVCAARADGIRSPLLLPTGGRSGFRDPKQQLDAWKRAVDKYKSEKEANKWVARPGSSAHQTGRAIDFYMGFSNSSSNVAKLRKTKAYSWMVANAHRFGFYPYKTEPWHWEYNPAGSAATEVELHESFTPYAHDGRFPGRFRYGQGIGHRRRHPRTGFGWTGEIPTDGELAGATMFLKGRSNGAPIGQQEFEDEFGYEFEVVKPASPQLSPLATAKFGLRKGSKRSIPVFGVCVHTTGGGPASKAKKDPRRSALRRALDFYLKGGGGFPHYVIAYDGSIIATCDEQQVAWHAGFGKKEREHYKTWTAPSWWSGVWNPKGARSPLDLLPKGARSANSGHIGVEMLADTTGYGFTNAQYESLAKLVTDIARRHKLPIRSAPSARLLGHEDVHPLSRQNNGGGWDPGAHRDKPRFSWSRLWSLMKANP